MLTPHAPRTVRVRTACRWRIGCWVGGLAIPRAIRAGVRPGPGAPCRRPVTRRLTVLAAAGLNAQRAEGTGSSALRIALWVVVALGLLALVGPKIEVLATHTATCLGAAASGGAC